MQIATIREETKIHQRWVQFALTPHFLHFSHSAHHFTSCSSPHITSILSLHFSSILFSLLNHLLSFYSLHSSLITIFSLHYISSHHYPHCFLQCVVFWSKTSSSQIVGSIACLKLVIGFGCDVVLTAKRQMIGSFSLFD